jgi:gluconolactonase
MALIVRRALAVTGAIMMYGSAAAWAQDGPREVKLEALTLQVPAAWKQQTPENRLRLGQFAIPAVEGDKEPAELTVFNFGFGGGVRENVRRWIDQFEAAERKVTTTAGKCPQGEYVFVEVAGIYRKPIGPPVQQRTQPVPGYRMQGVILAAENQGNYFLKLVGPDKTVASAADGFRASFGGRRDMEKPYDAAAVE